VHLRNINRWKGKDNQNDDLQENLARIYTIQVHNNFDCAIHNMALRPVARRQPRDRRLHNGRCYTAARKQVERNGVF
jgi:hypothetical protein